MAPPRGSAAYKKKDGTIALSKDSRSVSWTPVAPPGSKPTLTLSVSSITNLQQTPASSAKVMLKIFAQASSIDAAETHVFSFTAPTTARAEAEAIKEALSKATQSIKSGGVPLAAPGGSAASSAAMAIAGAVSSNPGGGSGDANSLHDDERLKQDIELQHSLLKSNPALSRTLMESLRTKPESISSSKFTAQFWSTRIHLLRAYAIEKNQSRGAYNVLSSIKVDPAVGLKITQEQIKLIFNQHPLVRRAYDENVPKIPEEVYFARFFQSRLFKKLKGEKITDIDPTDNLLDKYLQQDEDLDRAKRLMASHVPHIIDVEGNEENHSQRKGNKPDFTMRPTSIDRVPIIRTLNALSEKILSHVAPNDVDPSLPIGVDEETFNLLALRDLQGGAEEDRVILNIRDQSRFFSSEKQSDVSADARRYAKQDPARVLKTIQADLARVSSDTNLNTAIGVDNDSDTSEDEEAPKKPHVGSKASLSAATEQMLSAIREQRAQNDDISSTGFITVQTPSTSGLSSAVFERLSLTHATTTEFLQHFWSAFLSGDPSRADEIGKLLETLDRAMERIKAVATDAEAERQQVVDTHKKKVQAEVKRSGRQRNVNFNYDAVPGGAKAVNQLLAPTVKAIEVAAREYGKALKEQSEDAA